MSDLFVGLGDGAELEVEITTSTITPIIIPIAVKTLTIVIPCSLNKVFILSPSVVSSFDIFYPIHLTA